MDHLLIRKVRRRDRIARWIITFGGILIVISVLGILLLIAEVALPLFAPATQQVVARFRAPSTAQPALAVGVDEYLETAYTLSPEGVFTFFDAHDGRTLRSEALARPAPAARVVAAEGTARLRYTLLWSDGTVTLERLVFRPVFDADSRRTIASTLERSARFAPEPGAAPTRLAVARAAGDEGAVLARLTADGRLRVTRQVVATSLLGESTTETHTLDVADLPDAPLSAMTLDSAGDTLYLGTADGRLARWDLREPGEARRLGQVQAFADGRAVTALTLLLGDISLAVGDERGGHATWFPVPAEDGTKRLRRIHPLQPHQAPVTRILATANNKALLSVSADGRLLYDYTTNQRHLLS
ncbi:MAG: ABC transporter permease, partial [Candidatus Lambdaproteobacteria bacterium]|nr:ABC transporter permease [Candidatus Lambdaproteobacteria bacterium]